MGLTVEKCLQAWTNSLRQMNTKADIVFFGDSLTYYGDFSSVFPGKVVCNLGLRGDTIQGMIDRVVQVKILEPKAVYLMAGINDIATSTIESFKEQYRLLINSLQAELPTVSLIVQGLLPVNNEYFHLSCNNADICLLNNCIKDLVSEFGLYYLDLYSLYEIEGELPVDFTLDGIHINKSAYKMWYNTILRNNSKSRLNER